MDRENEPQQATGIPPDARCRPPSPDRYLSCVVAAIIDAGLRSAVRGVRCAALYLADVLNRDD